MTTGSIGVGDDSAPRANTVNSGPPAPSFRLLTYSQALYRAVHSKWALVRDLTTPRESKKTMMGEQTGWTLHITTPRTKLDSIYDGSPNQACLKRQDEDWLWARFIFYNNLKRLVVKLSSETLRYIAMEKTIRRLAATKRGGLPPACRPGKPVFSFHTRDTPSLSAS